LTVKIFNFKLKLVTVENLKKLPGAATYAGAATIPPSTLAIAKMHDATNCKAD
jgi:hypothetical protein